LIGTGGLSEVLKLPRLEILTPDPESETELRSLTVHHEWADDQGELCMWATARGNRPCLVAPGFAFYELRDDVVAATPFRTGFEGIIEDTYWRSVLPLFLQHRGLQVLHASAVAGPAGVVGFCGRAGAGKSTVAYGLSRRGNRLWADDGLVVSSVAPPRTAALAGEMRLLPDAREHLGKSTDGILLEAEVGEERDIALLIVLNAEPQPQTLSAGEGFAAVVEHAYCYNLEATKREMASAYLALLEHVPVVRLGRPAGFDGFEDFLDVVEGLMATGAP
jgi:hypothetical protein